MTYVLMGFAFAVPLVVYVLSRPRRSTRLAQLRAGAALLAAALIWGGAAFQYSVGKAPILMAIVGALMVGVAVRLLVKNRVQTSL